MYSFNIIDIWPYFVIALVFITCYTFNIKKSSLALFYTLFLFLALRYDVGWDYFAYREEIQSGIINDRYELLSKWILNIAVYLNFYPIAFILFAFITLFFVKIAIEKYSTLPIYSWLVYYAFPFFFFASLSTIRQAAAMSVLLYSFQFAKEKQYVKFFLTVYIASLFHQSAIVGVLILPLVLFPINRFYNLLLFAASFGFGIVLKDFVTNFSVNVLGFTRFQEYINAEIASSTSLQYVYYAVTLFNLIFFNALIKVDGLNKIYITLSNFGVVLFNTISFEPVTAGRISAFFMIFWIFIFPGYAMLFKKYKIINHLLFFLLLSLTFVFVFIYISAYNRGIIEKVSLLPYKFWFDNL